MNKYRLRWLDPIRRFFGRIAFWPYAPDAHRYPRDLAELEYYGESAEEIMQKSRERQKLRSIAGMLPQCWQLTNGEPTRDCPVVPDMTLWDCNGDEFTIAWVSLTNATDGPARAYEVRHGHCLIGNTANTLEAAMKLKEKRDGPDAGHWLELCRTESFDALLQGALNDENNQ